MKARKLVWQIYPAIILILLLVIGAVSWYETQVFHNFYLQQAEMDLEARANLIKSRVESFIAAGQIAPLREFCKEVGRSSGTRITVIADDGQVLADSNESADTMENHGQRPEVLAALRQGSGAAIRHSATLRETMLYFALPLSFTGGEIRSVVAGPNAASLLRMAVPITSLEQTLRQMYGRIAIGCLIILVLAALLSLYISRAISRPLENMTLTAERFAKGDFSQRMQPQLIASSSFEVAELAMAMDNMAELLDEKIRAIVTHRNQLETVFSSMVESVIALDLQERVISMNKAAAHLLGVKRQDVQGKYIQEVLRNIPLQQQVQQILSDQGAIEDEIVLQDEQGEKYLQSSVVSLHDGKSQRVGVLIVLNDVTNLRRLERIRRDFVANVSHELRTPITSIRGYVETLLDGALDNREDSLRFLEIVLRQSDRLNAIIDDLLALSRIEQQAKERAITRREGLLRPVLEAAVQTCQIKADQQGVHLALICQEELSLPMNSTLLEQAIVNLLANAITYSKKGDTVRVEAGLQQQGAAPQVAIAVIDNGCGIAREHLPRLFERFYRSDKARSREAGGTGLGLAIVKHIVQAHDGSVEVQSQEGQGSTFTIMLPAALES